MRGATPYRLHGDQRGQTIIESALVFGFLIILAVGMVEMSLFLYNYAILTDAAKDGVRCAIVHCPNGIPTTVDNLLKASVHSTSGRTLSVIYPDTNALGISDAPGDRVQVTVSYRYDPLFLKAPDYWTTVTISATSVGRIQF